MDTKVLAMTRIRREILGRQHRHFKNDGVVKENKKEDKSKRTIRTLYKRPITKQEAQEKNEETIPGTIIDVHSYVEQISHGTYGKRTDEITVDGQTDGVI